MPREKSAGAIIYRLENEVPHYLVLRYIPGHWEFARGHVEQGETEEETVRREIKEETGISDLKIIPGFREYTKFFFRKTYGLKPEQKKTAPWVFKLVIYYLAKTRTKEIKLSKENTDFLWLPIKDAIKRTTHKNAKALLKKADEFVIKEKT